MMKAAILGIQFLTLVGHLAAEPQLIIVSYPTGVHATYYSQALGGSLQPIVNVFQVYSKSVAEGGDIFMIVHKRGNQPPGNFHPDTLFLEVEDPLDIWMRDFPHIMPENPVKFRYRPDYLTEREAKGNEDDYLTMIRTYVENYDDFVVEVKLDGGNIVENGVDKAVTTMRAVTDNDDMDIATFKSKVAQNIGRSNICILPDSGDMTGHSDGLVAFVNEKILLVGDYGDFDQTVAELKKCFDNTVTYIRLKCYEAKWLKESRAAQMTTAVGAYINMLVTDSAIYLPVFGQTSDQEAIATVKANSGGKAVFPINTSGVGQMGGNIRCMSAQYYESTDIAQALIAAAKENGSTGAKRNTLELLKLLLNALKNE